METERFLHPHLEDRSLSTLSGRISQIFQTDPEVKEWQTLEPETILSKLKDAGEDVTDLLASKVKILKFILDFGTEELVNDPVRTLYASEVLNNENSVFDDPDFVPHITSLELAYFVEEMKDFGLTDGNAPFELKKVCSYLLGQEGFYEPCYPFTFLTKTDIFPEYMKRQIPETDREVQDAKEKGIRTYLALMKKLK